MFIDSIISNDEFFHHYQPIYDIQNWKVVGYESLFRTKTLPTPEIPFDIAKKKKKLYELDSRSIHKASLTYIKAGYSERYRYLFLNVFPSTIINPKFRTFINQIINMNGIKSQQLIFEINENEDVNLNMLKKSISYLKNLGFLIAIDDFGEGSSSIKSMIELQPDFIKLDRYFMEDLRNSEQKKDLIRYLLHFCREFNSELIVEGVEDNDSLADLKSLGVQYAQGYFLGRPTLLS
ncbi:diguanylate phosphodiesterase (plasmid) [Bacillus methanolicus]|uniref:EAL domain-containing protein n=1 Tax=Bacillus methanolicus TaxID=1471 RepID=UPI0023803AAC|nr:EAL domain-containing protein [Bacillus methanolicus]MDE3841048.1 diguanylate phosphodiesterase [Bacillus methanolicus]